MSTMQADPGTTSRKACCTPQRSEGPTPMPVAEAITGASHAISAPDLLALAGGTFTMGTDSPEGFAADGEGPSRSVTLRPFRIAATVVTHEAFAAFVRATHYITEAERAGHSFVFHLQLPQALRETSPAPAGLPWWRIVQDACWQRPEGPRSRKPALGDLPVVHVSWNDAQAYCAWAGVRLPTEAEWEYAARGGLEGKRYAWGDEPDSLLTPRCNIWRGRFPDAPAGDWWPGPMPAKALSPNGYGLYQSCGNVWEWCADVFSANYHRDTQPVDPSGQGDGHERTLRGGSFLCHDSYCNRYRVAARSSSAAFSAASNIGFRVAADSG